MRKYKFDNIAEEASYESLDELLCLPNIRITEYDGYYYVQVLTPAQRYIGLYRVDKKFHMATPYWDKVDYYLNKIESKARPVDLKSLKRKCGVGERVYDEDGIIGANRQTLEGLLLLPYELDITEHKRYYYIFLVNDSKYDSTMYKVDKSTGKASYMMFTEYILNVMDKAKEIDPATLRRGA